MIQPLARSTRDVTDMFFVLIRRNNRRGLRLNIFCHVERSRDIPLQNLKVLPRGSSISLRFAQNDKHCKRTDKWLAFRLFPHDRMKISRVIRTADQRPRSDVEKTFPACDVAVIIELLGRDVFDDRQMFRTRPQVLTHG